MRIRRLSRPARISLGYLAVAAVWIFASDSLVALLADDVGTLARLQNWKGAAFVLVTGLCLYALLRAGNAADDGVPQTTDAPVRFRAGLLTAAFVVMVAIIVGFGALAYRHQAATFKDHQYEKQAAIAELKAGQMERWFAWHRQEAEQLARDPDLMDQLRLLARVEDGRGAGKPAANVRAHFEGLLQSGRWASIGLYAPDGRPLLLAGRSVAPDAAHRKLIAAVAAEGAFRLNDLHAIHDDSADSARYRIDFLAPVSGAASPGPGAAVLVLSADPQATLFPMALSWPVPSASSESLLVRREGDEVVFMTTLRHADRKPLELRRPLSEANLTVVQAVLRDKGVFEGVDYRDAPVLSAFRPVSGTPWHIVAKTDTAEVMQPLLQQARLIFVIVLLATGFTGLAVAFLWRAQQAAFDARERQGSREREALAHKFDTLFQQARDSILLLDASGRIVEANGAALATYGYTLEEMRRLTAYDLRTTEAQASFERDFRNAQQPAGVLFETTHRRKDGRSFPVEVSSRLIDLDGQSYHQSFIRDISERKQGEDTILHQLKELRRWYEATLDREDRVGELKAEVNALLGRLGEPVRYPSQADDGN